MDPAGFLAFVVERRKEVDPAGFLAFVVERRKEVDALRAELPAALQRCVDPAKFAMDAVSEVFPLDRRAVRSPTDLAWACVLILEAVVPALADPDPEIGAARPMAPQAARDRARGMAAEWKEAAERKGGVEGAKPPDGHAFLQHVATFAVAEKEDRELYKRIVLTFSWRRQMPRLALTLGLEDDMEDIIEELITKGQQLDAVNFAYEAGLLENFSPVPLLKTYLEDSKKIYCAPDNLSTGSGQSGVAKSGGLALASDLSANDSTADYQSGSHTTLGLCRRGIPNASFEHGLQRQQGPQALSATLHSDIMSRGVMEPRPRKELFPATPATGCRSRLVQDCLSCLRDYVLIGPSRRKHMTRNFSQINLSTRLVLLDGCACACKSWVFCLLRRLVVCCFACSGSLNVHINWWKAYHVCLN